MHINKKKIFVAIRDAYLNSVMPAKAGIQERYGKSY